MANTKLWVALFPLLLSAGINLTPRNGAAEPSKAKPAPSPQDIQWNDPDHIHYFNYQEYLRASELEAQTSDSWKQLKASVRVLKVTEDEKFLKERLEKLIAHPKPDMDSKEVQDFVRAIWGETLLTQLVKLSRLNQVLNDSKKFEESIRQIVAATKLGATSPNLNKLLEDINRRPPESPDDIAARTNYLSVKNGSNFIDSLSATEIRQALETQKSFVRFLNDKKVPSQVVPAFTAAYQVLHASNEGKSTPEQAEMAHILPTLVRFLLDNHPVTMANLHSIYGMAITGPYDQPKEVQVDNDLNKEDPVLAGKTIAHEFEHVYDMYTGRYNCLDTELRGFKAAALYFQALKKIAPEKYNWLKNNNPDDNGRKIILNAEDYGQALRENARHFADRVALDFQLSHWDEGIFSSAHGGGRAPLREAATNTVFGLPRELAGLKSLRDDESQKVNKLEGIQKNLESSKGQDSREHDHKLRQNSLDLYNARASLNYYEDRISTDEMRLKRMLSEIQWMNKTQGLNAPYDLKLAVDKSYYVQ